MQKERDEQKVMMLVVDGEAEDFKTKNFNSRFPREGCSRPGRSFKEKSQAFMKETMDVARSEEKWPSGSFPRLSALEVDIGTLRCIRHRLVGRLVGLREPFCDRS